MDNKKYNYCFDFIKGIACICVVLMHCEFPGEVGILVQSVSRFCVPYFFMISGYFCYYQDISKAKNTSLKIKHIVKITLIASIFYLVFAGFCYLVQPNITSFGIKEVIAWIVFNDPIIIAGQLWFLFALIYVYILYMVVQKYNKYNLAYKSIPILIMAYIFLAQGLHVLGVHVENYIYRNFLIEGFTFFMLGHWLHKNELKFNVSNRTIIFTVILSTIMCIVERKILGRDFGVNISTFIQVIAIFLYGINNSKKHKGILQVIGKKYSMFVYILHPFVWHSLEMIYNLLGISQNSFAMYVMPILIVVLTLILSILCVYCNGYINKKHEKIH